VKLITIPSFAHQLFARAAMPGGAAKLPPIAARRQVVQHGAKIARWPKYRFPSVRARSAMQLRFVFAALSRDAASSLV
jgi:hypothetical protein